MLLKSWFLILLFAALHTMVQTKNVPALSKGALTLAVQSCFPRSGPGRLFVPLTTCLQIVPTQCCTIFAYMINTLDGSQLYRVPACPIFTTRAPRKRLISQERNPHLNTQIQLASITGLVVVTVWFLCWEIAQWSPQLLNGDDTQNDDTDTWHSLLSVIRVTSLSLSVCVCVCTHTLSNTLHIIYSYTSDYIHISTLLHNTSVYTHLLLHS